MKKGTSMTARIGAELRALCGGCTYEPHAALGSFPDPGVGLGTSLTRGTANVEVRSGYRMEF